MYPTQHRNKIKNKNKIKKQGAILNFEFLINDLTVLTKRHKKGKELLHKITVCIVMT